MFSAPNFIFYLMLKVKRKKGTINLTNDRMQVIFP